MQLKDITVQEALNLLHNSDRALIIEQTAQGQQIITKGWVADIKEKENEELLQRTAKRLRCICETRRKDWKEKELLPPVMPEQTPQYKFKDMEVRIYYALHI